MSERMHSALNAAITGTPHSDEAATARDAILSDFTAIPFAHE